MRDSGNKFHMLSDAYEHTVVRKIRKFVKIFSPKISLFSCPKLDEDQKKKGLHSNLVRFLAQN